MTELVGKNKRANLNDNVEANNKVEVDRNNKAVDLDDVKISNIIKESEVIGGTAGISSILQSDNHTEDDKINTVDRPRDGSHVRRDGSHDRRGRPRSARSSKTDDDFESGYSAQNVTSINTTLPEKFEFYQGKKRQQKEAKKHSESSLKKKDKKKTSLKDRSKAYEYSYDTTYLGGQSRHSSLENMNMQTLGYSPYAQAQGYGAYQTGRPAVQQQHWDQYGYARDPRDRRDPRDFDPYARDPYRRDYW